MSTQNAPAVEPPTLRESADEMGRLAAERLKLDEGQCAYISGLLYGFALRMLAAHKPVRCSFCGVPHVDLFACPRCGWKVGA